MHRFVNTLFSPISLGFAYSLLSRHYNCKQTEKSLLLEILQLRYAAGTKDMLDRYFKGEDFPAENYIVKDGELAPQYR